MSEYLVASELLILCERFGVHSIHSRRGPFPDATTFNLLYRIVALTGHREAAMGSGGCFVVSGGCGDY